MHAYTVQRLYKALLDDISQVRAALLQNDNLMICLYKFPDLKDIRPGTFEAIRPSMTCHIW